MNTYDHWVAESVAQHSIQSAQPVSIVSTLEFAQAQYHSQPQPVSRAAALLRRLADYRPAALFALLTFLLAVAR